MKCSVRYIVYYAAGGAFSGEWENIKCYFLAAACSAKMDPLFHFTLFIHKWERGKKLKVNKSACKMLILKPAHFVSQFVQQMSKVWNGVKNEVFGSMWQFAFKFFGAICAVFNLHFFSSKRQLLCEFKFSAICFVDSSRGSFSFLFLRNFVLFFFLFLFASFLFLPLNL